MPLPLLPLAIAGASGLVGALSNRGRTSKSSQTTTQSTTPEADGLNSVLMNLIRSRLQGSTDLSGYSAEGIKGINATYDDANTGLSAELTARGLSAARAATTAGGRHGHGVAALRAPATDRDEHGNPHDAWQHAGRWPERHGVDARVPVWVRCVRWCRRRLAIHRPQLVPDSAHLGGPDGGRPDHQRIRGGSADPRRAAPEAAGSRGPEARPGRACAAPEASEARREAPGAHPGEAEPRFDAGLARGAVDRRWRVAGERSWARDPAKEGDDSRRRRARRRGPDRANAEHGRGARSGRRRAPPEDSRDSRHAAGGGRASRDASRARRETRRALRATEGSQGGHVPQGSPSRG